MTPTAHILAAIDTGLQTAGDTAYGNDRPGTCWRCGAEGDDLCAPCREELLAETPAGKVTGKSITVMLSLDTAAFEAAIDALLASAGCIDPELVRRQAFEHIHITSEGTRSE